VGGVGGVMCVDFGGGGWLLLDCGWGVLGDGFLVVVGVVVFLFCSERGRWVGGVGGERMFFFAAELIICIEYSGIRKIQYCPV